MVRTIVISLMILLGDLTALLIYLGMIERDYEDHDD